jgi:outer membrane lipoprotein-sorting protein
MILLALLLLAGGTSASPLAAMFPPGYQRTARALERPSAPTIRQRPNAPARRQEPALQVGDAAPTPAQELTAAQIMEAAAARYRGATAICADFAQERTVTLLRETRRGRGRLCQQQPNLFSMRFSEPSGDRVIADGKDFCQYTPSTDPKQAICIPMSRAGTSYDFHKEFLDRPAEKYNLRLNGQEAVDGSQTHRVVLVPKQAAGYRQATLWIDARTNLLRRVELNEENGTVQRITMSNIDLQATPPASSFRVDLPAGVQVVRP